MQRLSPTCVVLFADFTSGLSITTPEQRIEKAKGETAYLPCKFTLSPEDQGPLDIEWLISPSDNQIVDQVVSLINCWSLLGPSQRVSRVCLHIDWGLGESNQLLRCDVSEERCHTVCC